MGVFRGSAEREALPGAREQGGRAVEIATEVDRPARLRKHTVAGHVTTESLKAALKAIYSQPDYDPEMNSLWDFREARFPSVSHKEIEQFADFVMGHWGKSGKSRTALVVSREFEMGLTKMYEVFVESRTTNQVEVFTDMDEALKWILA